MHLSIYAQKPFVALLPGPQPPNVRAVFTCSLLETRYGKQQPVFSANPLANKHPICVMDYLLLLMILLSYSMNLVRYEHIILFVVQYRT